ncbi:hypothetical protein [Escherichia coli]|nr:hypothetical protein [Escherichia coli]
MKTLSQNTTSSACAPETGLQCADAVSLSEGIIQLSFLKNTHLFVI